ncbi:hypothetical protein B296_00058765 [Ensete ventricosum]|uniref:Uncharacterized protein n=1 Tax=Ensete ventricosum TaxID=4639 RepID=A0A426XKD6_ENSVE|nr:hypothetical protein B296_00058765 [Ensete ventricosum]
MVLRVAELEKELERAQQERAEALQRLEASDKELNEVRGDLSEARKQVKEARVRARKADDDLLKSMKDLEGARAELSKQAISDYKDSDGFKEGLKRMGQSLMSTTNGSHVPSSCIWIRSVGETTSGGSTASTPKAKL